MQLAGLVKRIPRELVQLYFLSYKVLLLLAARLFYTRPQLCAEAKPSPRESCYDSTESRGAPQAQQNSYLIMATS